MGPIVLCVSLIGCTTGDPAPDPEVSVLAAAESSSPAPAASSATAASAASARVPIEQAGPQIVMHDAARYARAFENGPVGAPPPASPKPFAATAAAVTATPAATCHLPPGEPCDPPPPPSDPFLSITGAGEDSISLSFRCGASANQIVRTSPTFATVATNCVSGVATSDFGLQPGTTYCYAFRNTDGSIRPAVCARTRYLPYVFNNPTTHATTQAESDAMITAFDWTHTDPVFTTIETVTGTQTALYSMDILVQTEEDFHQLRNIGIHTQSYPLMPDEQAVWNGDVLRASAQGKSVGFWISAIVPAPIYNDLRAQAITGIANGQPIGIKAMVFHRINQPGGAFFANRSTVVSPLDPTYLGQQGIAFNGVSPEDCDPGPPRTCTVRQGLFGWLFNKAISVAVDLVSQVIDDVRQLIGSVEKLIRGEVNVTLQLTLNNSDELFGLGERTISGWSGQPLLLKNLEVKVYQGLAEFTATTDAQGNATVSVSKGLSGKICLVLDNARVKLVDSFIAREACIGTFSATGSAMVWPQATTDQWVNVFAAMTDAAEYVDTVMRFHMAKVSVLTGWQSAIFTGLNGEHSFTPCTGRMPNLVANLGYYSFGQVIPLISELSELSEFLLSYDIILAANDARSRGVGVHEFGHAVTCELLRNTDQTKAATAWADAIVATLSGQDPSSQPSMIIEGIADFIALQVVGGTNYATGDNTRSSRGLRYCMGDVTSANSCMERQSTRCDGTPGCDKTTNIRWVVSVLQDIFDQPDPSPNLPNDGSLWSFDSSKQILVPHRAANQVSATEGDVIRLPGSRIRDIFNGWGSRGSTLRYDSFFGGAAAALRSNAYDLDTACALFAPHEQSGTCPSYVTAAYGASPQFGRGTDVVVRSSVTGEVNLWTIAGPSLISNLGQDAPGLDWQIQGSGDFNGDGQPDILWRNTNGTVTIWFMADRMHLGGLDVGWADPGAWSIEGVGDFNNDGRSDILWRGTSGEVVIWFEGNSSDKAVPGWPVDLSWKIKGVGDFDGDGTSDILWRNSNGQVAIWYMSGGARIGGGDIGGTDPSGIWSIQGVGDFDGDRASDILWRDTSGQLSIWPRGDINLHIEPSYQNAGGPVALTQSIAGIGDFDADGPSDLLWNLPGGGVAIWFMSNGQFRSDATPTTLPAGWQINTVLHTK